jgi:hypothetical protein
MIKIIPPALLIVLSLVAAAAGGMLDRSIHFDPTTGLACVADGTSACVPIGTLDSTSHAFVPALAGKTIAQTATSPGASLLEFHPTYSGTMSSSFSALQLTFNDSLAAGSNYVYPLSINHVLNSSAITGIRPGLTAQTTFEHATGNDAAHGFYLGGSFVFVAGAPDNGTETSPQGYGYGDNPWCHFVSGATNWAGCIGSDIIAQLDAGSSASRRIGAQVESDGQVQGTDIDTAVDIWHGAGQVQWRTGLLFDDSRNLQVTAGGEYPISTGGTGIKFGFGSTVSTSLYAGIDMSMLTSPFTDGGDPIILPANNGGLSFGASGAGGRIASQATSNGPQLLMLSNDLRIVMGGTTKWDVSSTAAALSVPLTIYGSQTVYGPQTIWGSGSSAPTASFYASDYVAGTAGSGFYMHTKAATGNSDTEIVAFQAGNSAYAKLTTPGTFGAAAYQVGSDAGVSCAAGTVNLTTFTVTNGIVTHC